MIVEKFTPSSMPGAAFLVLSLILLRFGFNRYATGLHNVPGPLLASCTDLWRLFVVKGRRPEMTHIKLHEKYGKIVRLGPRTISIADPNATKVIYGLGSGFVKSDFYPVQQTVAEGRALHSLFNTTDNKFHAKLRRSVANAYAMSTLVTFEPFVDSTTTEFLKQLKERYADRADAKDDRSSCDLGAWLQFYAFDVIGELTYSKRLGFVDTGTDVNHIISDLEALLNYVSVVGQMPILDRLLAKNPIKLLMSKWGLLNSNTPVVEFARKQIAERDSQKGEQAVIEKREKQVGNRPARKDFLTAFKEARLKNPDFISEQRVLALTVANMFAGSDTTAITLRAIIYYLLKNPSKMARLTEELVGQSQSGNFTRDDALVRWEEVRELPYLTAVINEALRCHPAAGLPLERVVPAGGMEISGYNFPGGTIIGCSAWVLHRDEEIFGEYPDQFRPERWIDASTEQRAKMNNMLFSFGAGSRTCIGRNISLLEIYKLVPAMIRTFELELADEEKSWELHNAWFVKQSGLRVRLKTREKVL